MSDRESTDKAIAIRKLCAENSRVHLDLLNKHDTIEEITKMTNKDFHEKVEPLAEEIGEMLTYALNTIGGRCSSELWEAIQDNANENPYLIRKKGNESRPNGLVIQIRPLDADAPRYSLMFDYLRPSDPAVSTINYNPELSIPKDFSVGDIKTLAPYGGVKYVLNVIEKVRDDIYETLTNFIIKDTEKAQESLNKLEAAFDYQAEPMECIGVPKEEEADLER